MDTRKVQQVGSGTYTVSLLREWAEEYDVEAGDTVYVSTYLDGSLVVRRSEEERDALETARIDLDRPEPAHVERVVNAGYAVGFRRLTLTASEGFSTEQRRAVGRIVRSLNGVEIVEETDTELTVRAVLDISDVSIRQSVLQLRFLALSMVEESLNALVGRSDGAEHVHKRDDEADRVFGLVARHFHRALTNLEDVDRLGVDRPQLFHYYRTARNLERVADNAVEIAGVADEIAIDPDAEILAEIDALGADARRVVEDASNAVVGGRSTDRAHAALDARDRVVDRSAAVHRAVLERSPEEAYLVTRALDSVVRVAKCGGNVAEIAIQDQLRS